jgi:hypothetical protein
MPARDHRDHTVGTGRRESARLSNEWIAMQAERLHVESRVPMVCECGDPDCGEIILIRLREYRQERRRTAVLTVAGHH